MKNKMDARGVSPVIATVLLIAATGIAAGVIIAYVGGLSVFTPAIRDISVEGNVYDRDTSALENYSNGDLVITATVTSGTLRDVGDPAYGFTVGLTSARTGASISLTRDEMALTTANYGTTFTSAWIPKTIGASTENVAVRVTIPITAGGDIARGSGIIVSVNAANMRQSGDSEVWTVRDTINVLIGGRDPQVKTGYDGAYLLGVAYTA